MKGVTCSECGKEIEEERIIYKEGKIVSYPAFCEKCGMVGY